MSNSELVLSCTRESWRAHVIIDSENDGLHDIQSELVRRHRCTCYYCDFRSIPQQGEHIKPGSPEAYGYMEVHNLDNDHNNNNMDNQRLVCPFCHQVFHAGNTGYSKTSVIIYMPEISQRNLNRLCHGLFVAIALDDPDVSEAASRSYFLLRSNMMRAINMFGHNIDDPASLGHALMKLSPAEYRKRDQAISGLRLLPDFTYFEQAVIYWRDHVWNNLPISKWGTFSR